MANELIGEDDSWRLDPRLMSHGDIPGKGIGMQGAMLRCTIKNEFGGVLQGGRSKPTMLSGVKKVAIRLHASGMFFLDILIWFGVDAGWKGGGEGWGASFRIAAGPKFVLCRSPWIMQIQKNGLLYKTPSVRITCLELDQMSVSILFFSFL